MSEKASSSAVKKSNTQAKEESRKKEELGIEDLYTMESYFDPEIGDMASSKYKILKKLGQGQFSNVWLCKNVLDSSYIAMKVVRSKSFFNECAYHEINMLKKIHSADPSDPRRERLAQLLDHFTIPAKVEGIHVCMVFPAIGNDLFSFIHEKFSKGAPTDEVKKIITQILEGVDYLHSKCGIIHTDLKPENILISFNEEGLKNVHKFSKLVGDKPKGREGKNNDSHCTSPAMTPEIDNENASDSESDSVTSNASEESSRSPVDLAFTINLLAGFGHKIKIFDFGNSCSISDHLSPYIQTRNYRSPEIIIGANYGTPVDIWSIGCIAFELATGHVLFSLPSMESFRKDEIHLGLMVQMLGNMPKAVMDTGLNSFDYFLETGDLINIDTSERCTLLQRLVNVSKWTHSLAYPFSEFLMVMLQYDPKRRATAAQCLQHSWIKE